MILWGRVMPECQNISFTNNDAVVSVWGSPGNGSPHVVTGMCRTSSTSQCWTWRIWGGLWEPLFNLVWQSLEKWSEEGARGCLMHSCEGDQQELSSGWDRGLEERHSSREGITGEKRVCCSLRNSLTWENNGTEIPFYIYIYICT